ncbi:M1 family metallopeptidase [Aquimarina sp. U1-2]|uniref:M1 family metallopeptidase n=1 Tax=Aquimarina sp. U1-2 TaxID=2823141 RepID=UPI001AECAC6C|nr:M1 family metallopeptidase [Aquimarina sp. U1-2]MBP2834125.1 M1 family metallopeptidase [Aquimarina sp. U1-2]
MKFKTKFPLFIVAFIMYTSYSQSDLYIFKEIQKAYHEETRSKDGMPGEKYWQNTVDYKIDVSVTPEKRLIDGKETVIYKNSSPDELSQIVIRLYYDVFKTGNQRAQKVNENDIGKGVDIKKIIVNQTPFNISNRDQIRRRGTNLYIKLPTPLKSGEQVTLQFEWQQKVPLTLERTGAIDSTSFFVGYWYPQVSVYDDIFGWDESNYTFQTEFYNNLANYDVNITAPDNFIVWATGELQNSDIIFPDHVYKKYEKAKLSDTLVHIIQPDDLKNLKLKSNRWNFKAKEVTDFAFAMSDHYLWDALSQKVSGKNVMISTAFPEQKAQEYTEITKVVQKAMHHFSASIPGISYPYPNFTTFIGLKRGGMEFPMMANNADNSAETAIHELFHTYFPMYVRINESKFAWMDEGWADFFTTLLMHKYFKDETNNLSLYAKLTSWVDGNIGRIGDLPAITPSNYLENNYGYHSYSLPSLTYALLYQYLGEEKFIECFKIYVQRWAKKSPTPYDFFYTFEDISGKDLSWLWNSWYFKMGYPDLAIKSFKKNSLEIERLGDRLLPVSIAVKYKDNQEPFHTVIDASVWKDNNRQFSIKIPSANKVSAIEINPDFPDFNRLNNYFPKLSDQYDYSTLDEGILGQYLEEEYSNVKIIVSKENNILKLTIPASEFETYLTPTNKNKFISLDKTLTVKFTKHENEAEKVELYFIMYDFTLTALKK